jgi:lipopolysaccharide biosynthesis glycosyltransferase
MLDETSKFTRELNYKMNNNKTIRIKTRNKYTKLFKKPKINFYLIIIIIILIVICLVQFFTIYFSKKEKQNNNDFNTNDTDDTIYTSDNNHLGSLYLYKGDNSLFIKNNKIDDFQDKKKIHIAMALDNKGVYPTLVSMTSALENQDKKNTILIYYLLLSWDFETKKIKIFESLKDIYTVLINYYIIPNIFKYVKEWKKTYTVYYKLLLPLMFPELERIIFLDGDTIIFKDLSEMYDLPFNNNYVLGYPFHTPYIIDQLGIKPKHYVNGGVLLFNIAEIRKNNMDLELLLYTLRNKEKLIFLEQDTLNYVYNEKIGLLPFKFGIYLYGSFKEAKDNYLYKLRIKVNYDEVEKALEDPTIVHFCCCNPKIWFKNTKHERGFNHTCHKYQKIFYYYANKTKYYDEIYNKYMK